MAIQNRRGIYSSGFDPTKLVPGEFAVVQSGDPDGDNGYSLYLCFASRNVQRIALSEEVSSGGSNVTWTPSITTGEQIGVLTINGTAYNILAPKGGSSDNITNDSNVSGTTVSDALSALSDEIASKGTYSKPSGGIPKTDLASAVQTSLDKADTALQTAPVTSVNSRTGAVTGLEEKTTIVTKTSSDTSQTLAENTFYVWPEMTSLTITCPSTGGPYAFRFTSGSTATTLTMSGITMPDDFTVEANKVYEINVYQGYGLAASWAVS